MRILELCTSPDNGGLELYMVRASIALAARGEEVLATVGPDSRIEERLQQANIETTRIAVRFAPLPVVAARRLAGLIDARKIDCLHAHWGRDLALAALAKQLSTRTPRLVYTRHMQITRSKKDAYHNWLYRRVDAVLTISEAMTNRVRQYLARDVADRVHTLYLGVPAPASPITDQLRREMRNAWGVPDHAVLVGLFSRVEKPKGQHLLVEAMRRARDEHLPLRALMVGRVMDPDYAEGLKASVQGLALDDRIRFEGFSDDIQQWMQACDMVALTTREETFGLVLIEAMRAGVAVIGSDRGGVPEIIRPEENGLLFRSFDAGDLYRQLRRLTRDPALRGRLAARGQRDADRRFNDDAHFQALHRHLQGAARAPTAGGAPLNQLD